VPGRRCNTGDSAVGIPQRVPHFRQATTGGRMEWIVWATVAVAIGCAGWFGAAVVRLLGEIAQELRHIRKHLQSVSGELDKISGPLGYVQKIYGLGESVLGAGRHK
jgi:hypothetical protein